MPRADIPGDAGTPVDTPAGMPQQHRGRTGHPRRRDRISYQIAIRLLLVATLFVAFNLVIVVWLYAHDTGQLDDDVITLEAGKIATAILHSADGRTSGQSLDIGPAPGAGSRRAFVVRTADGTIIARNADRGIDVEAAAPPPFPRTGTQRENRLDGFLLVGTRQAMIEGQSLWITVAIEGEGFTPFLGAIENEVVEHVLVPMVPLSVLLLLFNILVVRSTLKPLSAAVRDADALDPATITRRLGEPASPWEVRALVTAVNGGLDRLERAMRALQEFAADAAHELRTPLSIMTLTIGRLPDSEQKCKLQQDTAGMTRLVNQMLDMAYASALQIEPGAQADLTAIARRVAAQLTPLAIEHRREIRFRDAGGTVIRGHDEALARALRNVIENALAHTPAGTAVEVTSGPGPQWMVRDHGPGIPVADRARLFERFRQGDRRRGTGTGLGLGIVEEILRAHGGRVEIGDAPGRGATFRLMFAAQPVTRWMRADVGNRDFDRLRSTA